MTSQPPSTLGVREGVVVANERDEIVFASRGVPALLGIVPTGLVGKPLATLGPLASGKIIERVVAGEGDGQATIEISLSEGDGSGLRVALVRDVTERRRVAEEHAILESVLRAQGDLGIGVAILEDARFVFVNDAWARMCGYTAEEMLAMPSAFDVFMPEHRQRLIEACNALHAGDALDVSEESVLHKTGALVPIEYCAKAFRHDHRGRALAVIRDVGERKKRLARTIMEERITSLGTLAAGVAHEINNPLACVMANLDMIAEELRVLPRDERTRELEAMTNEARGGADRVRKIVRGLHVFSRREGDRRGLLDVRGVLETSLGLASEHIARRARLVKDFQAVPSVEAEESRLGEVFLNLLVNAAWAIPEGDVAGHEIRVTTRTDDRGSVVVEVTDTGCGISPDAIGRVFDPFFTTKPVGQGAGLGLSICHSVVVGLGGAIAVESSPGRGSVFRVTLPAARASIPASVKASMLAPKGAGRSRVLVVEDDEMLRSTLRRMLGHEHDVTLVGNGVEARDVLLGDQDFDVIVCDLVMPEMTGMELYDELSVKRPALLERIVFITGGAFAPRAADFLARVQNHRLEKPFEADVVRALVQAVADGAHEASPRRCRSPI